MSLIDRDLLPVACTLTPGAGAAQLAAWQEFNDDYLLDIDRTAAQITVHYPKIDDATARLTSWSAPSSPAARSRLGRSTRPTPTCAFPLPAPMTHWPRSRS